MIYEGPTKNWIAVEGWISGYGSEAEAAYKIASSAPRGPAMITDRNVFAIFVTYYIKVKLTLSGLGSEVSLKLPFVLGHLDESLLTKETPPNAAATAAAAAATDDAAAGTSAQMSSLSRSVGDHGEANGLPFVDGIIEEECAGNGVCTAVDMDSQAFMVPYALCESVAESVAKTMAISERRRQVMNEEDEEVIETVADDGVEDIILHPDPGKVIKVTTAQVHHWMKHFCFWLVGKYKNVWRILVRDICLFCTWKF